MWPNTVRESDLRIEYYRGSGHGGQKKQKTSSACRITHIITGLSSTSEATRSQDHNRKDAFRKLAAKLVPLMEAAIRQNDFQVSFNKEEVRVYRAVDRIVKDKRLKNTFDYYDVIDHNGLDKVIEELVKSGV
jgi:peptide chain release factor 1